MLDVKDSGAGLEICQIQALFMGGRIDVRELEHGEIRAINPLTIRAGESGLAVLFRYGVVVLVDLRPDEAKAFLQSLAPHIVEPFEAPETEELTVVFAPTAPERMNPDGTLSLVDSSVERFQLVANILAKSVVLAYYEERVATIFDQIEHVAEQVKRGITQKGSGRDLLRQIGDVLIAQTQTVGRVEVTEKPEITWDRPDLDRLYERLSLEYELRERDRALSRKLEFISHTAQTYLDMAQTRQSLRLEWYIVALILIEIVLIVYDIFLASH
jgi:uncharacterized Rmd1/YagE family protein